VKQLINLGTGPNSGVGDTLYSGSVKINENFDELYSTVGNAVTLDHIHAGTGISVAITPGIATISNTSPHVQSDWNATTGLAAILNKPVLSSIAITGSYNDLLDTPHLPTLSEVAISGDYNDLINAPVFPELATVAVTGDFADLLNKPQGDRLVSGNFSVVLDPNSGELNVPDGLRFTLSNSDNNIYGPGANYSLRIISGSGDVYNGSGGHVQVIAGDALYGSGGNGGHIWMTGGVGEQSGGDINITAGTGTGGYGYGNGDIHSTGGNVTIKAGTGTGRGGSVIISSNTDSVYNSAVEVVGLLNGDVVIETNRPAGHVWTYGADGTARSNHTVSQTSAVTCPVGIPTEIYSSWYFQPSLGYVAVSPGIKLFISCTGEVSGDATGEHTEVVDVMIARRPGLNTVVLNTFNRVHTSSAPLMTITTNVDPTTNMVKVYCQPTDSANPVQVEMNSTEHYVYSLSGAVIV
jgi:hypothetical protein